LGGGPQRPVSHEGVWGDEGGEMFLKIMINTDIHAPWVERAATGFFRPVFPHRGKVKNVGKK